MPEDPVARLVQNLLNLERIANTISRDAQQRYQELFEDIVADLREIDPTGPPQATYRRLRTEKFIEAVKSRLRDFTPAQTQWLKDQLAPVGRQQAKAAEATLIASIGDSAAVTNTPITQQRLRAILNTDPFQGRLLKEHTERLSANTLVRVRDQIRIGMANEETIGDMVRRVRGRQAGFIRQDPTTGAFVKKGTRGAIVKPRFQGGALSTTTREAEALVRTAVNHVSNEGAMGTYRANVDVLRGVEWVSTLDDRTSEICLERDGRVWPVDSPDIEQPPAHYNCRSYLAPAVDWEGLGLDEPPAGTRSARDLSGVSEADLRRKVSARRRTGDFGDVTQVPTSVRAEAWLRGQPVRVQEKMLGVGKARLFRDGEITLSDLLRQDNSTVSLSELVTD